ncbi:MAG TPA: 3-hydroxyacyl-CoA dehydrogenase NAD-binding domain-containing protein [Ilumatobacteraceae bacterium]|nr:3-hydroxyacyl-CoA dehydrogenase NAD-binding domain-containing protein [Ilumatobacteraceae bacterium]
MTGTIRTVGIVGSGIMGAGLAEVSARAGYDVIVASRSQVAADGVMRTIDAGLSKAVERGKATADERETAMSRIIAVEGFDSMGDCDLVIESVIEEMEVKRQLFSALDRATKPSAILATNTSTLPVIDFAVATGRPEQVCGIHFFNPATVMKLVEVVRPLTACAETIDQAVAFVTSCGKDAVVVEDHAGFIVNALLFPYLNNAVRMFERGTASVESIDTAMKGACNYPMGPFALLDLVGLDTSVAILETIHASFGNPADAPAQTLLDKVAAGHLGRKTKCGFYIY